MSERSSLYFIINFNLLGLSQGSLSGPCRLQAGPILRLRFSFSKIDFLVVVFNIFYANILS